METKKKCENVLKELIFNSEMLKGFNFRYENNKYLDSSLEELESSLDHYKNLEKMYEIEIVKDPKIYKAINIKKDI